MKSLSANVLAIACLAAAVSITLSWVDASTPRPPERSTPDHQGGSSGTPRSSSRATATENREAAPSSTASVTRSPNNPARSPRRPDPLVPSSLMAASGADSDDESPAPLIADSSPGNFTRAPKHPSAYGPSASEVREIRPLHLMAAREDNSKTPSVPSTSSDSSQPTAPSGAPQPSPAVAAVLLTRLPQEIFDALPAHEQAAIIELGTYAEEALNNPEPSSEEQAEDPAARAARIRSEADSYLRATLGFARFNRLSFLASAAAATAPAAPAAASAGLPHF